MNSFRRRPQRTKLIWTRGFLSSFLITLAFIYAVYFIPVPYYIYKPGSAEELKPMVKVAGGDPEEQGAFMLTTVTMAPSGLFNYWMARLNPNAEIRKKADVLRGSSEAEYSTRQEYVMLDSQSSAIQAAYHEAGIAYRIDSQGVLIMQTMEGYPAHGLIKPGDRLLKIGDSDVTSLADVRQELDGRQAGEEIKLIVMRNNKEKELTVALKELRVPGEEEKPAGESERRVGLGVTTAELLQIRPEQSDMLVTIDAKEIGGPSAGLLFALEIYNQLTPGDLTKGYRIAGTGTIDPEGTVCSIGGIRQKIVAADREKADIFFAPVDRVKGECNLTADVPNASDAIDQAKKIGTKMKVIPVATMEEAVSYLDSLEPKKS